MAYTAWSVSFGEQPSSAKWNLLGANDAFFDGLIGSGAAHGNWTPSWTNVTVGNGTVTAKYQQVGRNVDFRASLVFGSTSDITSTASVSVPVTAATYVTTGTTIPIAQCRYWNNSDSNSVAGVGALTNTTTMALLHLVGTSEVGYTPVDDDSPFNWAVNDVLHVIGRYEAAAGL